MRELQHKHWLIFLCKIVNMKQGTHTPNDPGDSTPLQSRFGALWLLAFPKTKITFERQEILGCRWDSGKYNGAADGDWENCVRSQGAHSEGDWGIIVLCRMFLVSCIFFIKCLYFSSYMAGYLLDRPRILELHSSSIMRMLAEPDNTFKSWKNISSSFYAIHNVLPTDMKSFKV